MADIPIHTAVRMNNLKQLKLRIQKGDDINAKDKDGETSLHIAIEQKCQMEIIELLLENGADVNATGKYQLTPLIAAVKNPDIHIVKMLLEHDAEIGSALHIAVAFAHCDDFKTLKYLLDNGANVNKKSYCGQTPLHWGASSLETEIESVNLLIDHGADINAQDDYYVTPAHCAASYCNKIEIMKRLLELGGDPNV